MRFLSEEDSCPMRGCSCRVRIPGSLLGLWLQMGSQAWHPPLCQAGHFCSTDCHSHGATAPYKPLSDIGDNKIPLLERGGMFIPKIREVSYMLPKSHHTPVPALPRGSQSAEGPLGLLCCSSWGSLVEDTLLFCQILLPGLPLCSQDPSGGLGSAGRVWIHF